MCQKLSFVCVLVCVLVCVRARVRLQHFLHCCSVSLQIHAPLLGLCLAIDRFSYFLSHLSFRFCINTSQNCLSPMISFLLRCAV